MFHISVASNS
uniref:Uncharacterized protein n=1 Tax=Arundo donax TaxID=35708 RepID=A0A0A9BTC0_ARUDO